MTELIKIISGGLFASIVTVLLTKLLELWQAKSQHNFGLQKIFFERKIIAAESAMAGYNILSVSLNNLAVLYGKLDNDTTEIEEQLSQILAATTEKQFSSFDSTQTALNSLTLYFDFDDRLDPFKSLQEFFSILGKLGPIIDRRKELHDFSKLVLSEQERSKNNDAIKQNDQDFSDQLQKISIKLRELQGEIKLYMKALRTQMKKFE